MKKSARRSIVLGVTGSIAAYKACEIISSLTKSDVDVKVVLTKEGREFITPLTLQTLSRNKVFSDMFELPERWNPVHTSLAEEADLILIAPATANVIGKLAGGICDDLLTATILASRAPVLIAPAMNDKMYGHKIVQENIKKLKAIGYKFISPVKGRLACGYEGIGHLAQVSDIVKVVKKAL